MDINFESDVVGKTVKSKKNLKQWIKKRDRQGVFKFYYKDVKIDFDFISELRSIFIGIKKFLPKQKIRMHLLLEQPVIQDKLSLTLMEFLIYSFQNETGSTVFLDYIIKQYNTTTNDLMYSPIKYLSRDNYSKEKFNEAFEGKRRTDTSTLRRNIVKRSKNKDKVFYLSKLQGDVATFLSLFLDSEELITRIAELMVELVENATTHGDADCLFEISITDSDFQREGDEGRTFFGINICVLNFSDIQFSMNVKNKILNSKIGENFRFSSRYDAVREAYNYHSQFFDDSYSEQDFWNLAALQDHISGRPNNFGSGGAGLEKLLNSVQKSSESDNCYILAGNRATFLLKELLSYDKWLGMNDDQNFISDLPNEGVFAESPIVLNGTGINLNFIFEQK